MASIGKIGSSWRAVIRLKDQKPVSASFKDQATAELWAKYTEDLMRDMREFNIPKSKLIDLQLAVTLKCQEMGRLGNDARSISDVALLTTKEFSEWASMSVGDISYKMLIDKANKMLNSKVRKGGSQKSNTGHERQQSSVTVLRKFRILGSAISYAIEMGAEITNPVPSVCAYIQKFTESQS